MEAVMGFPMLGPELVADRKFSSQILAVVLCGSLLLAGCAKIQSDWPMIVSVAGAIANLATVADPMIAALSQEAVTDLNTIESDYVAFMKNKTDDTLKTALIAAIEAAQQNLPANLAALHISDQMTVIRVTAAVNLILDFIDSIAGQIPQAALATSKRRAGRGLGPRVPSIPNRREIKARWTNDVCKGDAACVALLK